MRTQDSNAWPAVYGVSVLLVLGLFLFGLREVLSPVVLYVALVLLLMPFAGGRRYTHVLIVATGLLFIWVLRTTGFLLAPFILAVVTAYILDPVVDILEARGVPRTLGGVILALPAIALVLVALIVGIPALADQIEALIQQAPELFQRTAAWLERTRRGLLGVDLPLVPEEELIARLRALDSQDIVIFLQRQQDVIADRAWSAVLGLGQGIGTVLTVLGYVVLTPVLTFYLLRDWDAVTDRLLAFIPERNRTSWGAFFAEYDSLLARYLRGQVIAAVTVGVLTGVGLWIAGFPFAGLVGAVAGVFNLVPYLGLIVSLLPALVIAFLSGSVLMSLLKVAVVFTIVQIIDSTFVGPRIVGGSVGLHPVWVMLSLAVGSFFFGFVGLLIAVPAAVLIKMLARRGLDRYERSGLYGSDAASGSA